MKYINLHIAQTTNAIKPYIYKDNHKFKRLFNADSILKFVFYSLFLIMLFQLLRFVVS